MTIENIYFIAQIIAAVGILGTLVYGIAQIRINNSLARAQLTHATGIGVQDFFFKLGADPQVSRIWRLGCTGSDELSPEEGIQFGHLCRAAFVGNEIHFRLHQEGMIAGPMYDRSVIEVRHLINLPGVRAWWNKGRTYCQADFVELVETLIEDISVDG